MPRSKVSFPPAPRQQEVRPKAAAEMIGCSVPYIFKLMAEGLLDNRQVRRPGKERGIRWVSVRSIERFLSEQEGITK